MPRPHQPAPSLARRAALALALATLGASPGWAGGTAGADLDRIAADAAADLAPLIGTARGPASTMSPQAMGASLAALFARLAAARPQETPGVPLALTQAAHLARTAGQPASRALMGDLAREVLGETIDMAGLDRATQPVWAAWELADPVVREDGDLKMTAADVAAFQRLAARAGLAQARGPAAFWDARTGTPPELVFPARLNAWVAGAEAAWPDLDETQRRQVAAVLDDPAIPPAALLDKVIRTPDMIGWLAAVSVPLTEAERAANSEIAGYMMTGSFAGALTEAAAARIMGAPVSPVPPPSGDGATDALRRLNNWSAMTGESSSWDSFRYSTQGW